MPVKHRLWFGALVAFTAGMVWVGLLTAYVRAATHPQYHRVWVKTACLVAEDSAAHLKLLDYDPSTNTYRYGCFHKGY